MRDNLIYLILVFISKQSFGGHMPKTQSDFHQIKVSHIDSDVINGTMDIEFSCLKNGKHKETLIQSLANITHIHYPHQYKEYGDTAMFDVELHFRLHPVDIDYHMSVKDFNKKYLCYLGEMRKSRYNQSEYSMQIDVQVSKAQLVEILDTTETIQSLGDGEE